MSSISRTPADEIIGPEVAADGDVALFDSTTGKLLKRVVGLSVDASGNMTFPDAAALKLDTGIGGPVSSNLLRLLIKNASDVVIVATTYKGARGGGVGGKGFGIGQEFELENSSGSMVPAAKMEEVWDDAGEASAENCRFDFKVKVDDVMTTVATIDRNGTSPVVVSGTEPTDPRAGTAWLQQ